ncbi:MAG: tetratricopeptide repeat protein, partial [Candidatus Rokuibacteriota bacterium]
LVPGLLFAQAQARVQGTVVDEKGAPVAGAQVNITSAEIGYDQDFETDKKGHFAVLFVDGTRDYTIRFEKEGHAPVQERLKPEVGGNLKKEFILPTAGSGARGGATETETGPTADPAVSVFNEGVTAFQAGDLDTAKQKFHRAMELNPQMVEAPAALAGIYADAGDADQAIAMADQVLAIDPANARALRVLYDVHNQRGDEAKAADALERLKSAEGGGTEAAIRLFNEGAEAARLGDLERARARFEQALGVDPELAPAHGALARVYFSQEQYDQAIAAAEKAYELDPGQASVLKYAYEGYRKKGDAEQARRVFDEMSTADPAGTAGALYENGVAMFNAGNMAGAQQALEQALQADPDLPKAHYTLGLAYANTGDTAKAKEHLQRFVELAPDDPDAGTAKEMLEYLG